MKSILLITNIYPNNDPNYAGTKVCHSFVKEWVKQGYNVRVIHFSSLFPRVYYWFGRMMDAWIRAKTGYVAYCYPPRQITQYEVDDIPVIYAPLRKLIPHRHPTQFESEKVFSKVCSLLDAEGFYPDVVTAHFVLPQLEMLYKFKQRYPRITTCMVLHGDGSQIPTTYPGKYHEYMNNVNVWGFRSVAFMKKFEERFGKKDRSFLCYSGIPAKYVIPVKKDFSKGVKHFVFVGSLFKLKNVDIILEALHKVFKDEGYNLDIVGSGAEEERLKKIVANHSMENHVCFHGKQPRDKAQDIIAKADCFITVSSREAFGLVYLEAMAKGCITIATEGQGMDGIIVDGKNGFLCPSRDVDALAGLIIRIGKMDSVTLESISNEAFLTASELTDLNVAKTYINNLL